jgi:oxygen-independent coproporphyrinogen-3 oxidase
MLRFIVRVIPLSPDGGPPRIGGVRAPSTGARGGPLGVYVHVPFCERVCPYCDFAVIGVGALHPPLERRFTEGVLVELERVCQRLGPAIEGRPLETVYLGGGTPSLLEPASVQRLLDALRARFGGEPAEITLELNPGRVERERIPRLAAAGITRVSVGVQALDDDVLRRLGRAHAAADARAGLEACARAGFRSLSADLIYGAPGQRVDSLLAGARELLALGTPHVSAYALGIEPDTPFARARARGRLRLPDEAACAEMGERLGALLEADGLERYEISSWARPGHRSRHNQRYWLREDVLGLGPSAASLVGSLRFQNERGFADWCARLGEGGLAWSDQAELDPDTERREALYLGLRRIDGVHLGDYAARYGAPPEGHLGSELAELAVRGLIERCGASLRLTARGRLFADEVFMALVEPA